VEKTKKKASKRGDNKTTNAKGDSDY